MSQRNLAWLLAVPALVIAAGVLMSFTAPPAERDYKTVRNLVDVVSEVDRSFYRQLSEKDKKKFVEDMINGGLRGLDDYSEYYNEEQYKHFQADNKGNYGGIGAFLGLDPATGTLSIASTMPESPAMEAGLLPNDLILMIDGKSTEGFNVDGARELVMGEVGKEVALTIRRAGTKDDFEVKLKRMEIQNHPVKGIRRNADDPKKWDFVFEADGIAYIRLIAFTETAGDELVAALKEADAAGAKGLILDLRDNPGGLLKLAESISDLFLSEGFIVHTRDRNNTGRDVKAKKDNSVWEVAAKRPMAVLINGGNGGSASAAEIVAAALQDNKRAVIVGERSYGKGCVQRSIVSQDEKTALKLTTEIWLTPNERHIHRGKGAKESDDWGVKPDAGFEVKPTTEQVLQFYLHRREIEMNRKTPPPEPKPGKGPPPVKLDPNYKDPVLEKAREHLKGQIAEIGLAPNRGGPKPG